MVDIAEEELDVVSDEDVDEGLGFDEYLPSTATKLKAMKKIQY